MARPIARDAEDFARLMLQTLERRGPESDWIALRELFEQTAERHPGHAYVGLVAAKPARRNALSVPLERLRTAEFAHLERRRDGAQRNAAVLYRCARPAAAPAIAPATAPAAAAPVSAPSTAPATSSMAALGTCPVAAPVTAPLTAPATSSVAAPVTAPVAAPVPAPLTAPATSSEAAPVTAPVAAPVPAPLAAPATAPVAEPATAPAAAPATAPVAAEVQASVRLDLQLPYEAPPSHPLLDQRRAAEARREQPSARRTAMTEGAPNSPWRRRLLPRRLPLPPGGLEQAWSTVRACWGRFRATVAGLATGAGGR